MDAIIGGWTGEQRMKNIAEPIACFRVKLQVPHSGKSGRASPKRPELSDKVTIAVLPFKNIGRDPEQEFFAEGLAEDLITDLSKVPGLMVIARNSSFVYKDKSVDLRSVASDLGVRYVILTRVSSKQQVGKDH